MKFTLAMAFGLLTFVGVLCFLATTSYETPGLFVALAVTVMFPAALLAIVLHGDVNQRVFAVGALIPMALLLMNSHDVFQALTLNPVGDTVNQFTPSWGPPGTTIPSPVPTTSYMNPDVIAQAEVAQPQNPLALPPTAAPLPLSTPPTITYTRTTMTVWRLSHYSRSMIDRTWSFAALALLSGSTALGMKLLLKGQR